MTLQAGTSDGVNDEVRDGEEVEVGEPSKNADREAEEVIQDKLAARYVTQQRYTTKRL